MHGVKNKSTLLSNFMLIESEEVCDGGEGSRGERPLANALADRAHHLLQPVDVRL